MGANQKLLSKSNERGVSNISGNSLGQGGDSRIFGNLSAINISNNPNYYNSLSRAGKSPQNAQNFIS